MNVWTLKRFTSGDSFPSSSLSARKSKFQSSCPDLFFATWFLRFLSLLATEGLFGSCVRALADQYQRKGSDPPEAFDRSSPR